MQTPKQRPARVYVICATISFSSALLACSGNGSGTVIGSGQQGNQAAIASVRGVSDSDSALGGNVRFRQDGDSVRVIAAIGGLEPGKTYAIDVREDGFCPLLESGGRGVSLPGGSHPTLADTLIGQGGDSLPDLRAGAAGIGHLDTTTLAFSLDSADSNSIIGKSLVVSETQGDSGSGTAGNSGTPVACGIIAATTLADTTGGRVDTVGTDNANGIGNGTGNGTGTGTLTDPVPATIGGGRGNS
jgi:Cu/Zn superoxide dismutase